MKRRPTLLIAPLSIVVATCTAALNPPARVLAAGALTVGVTLSPPAIPANGMSGATVSVAVADSTSGTPVPGAVVTLSTNGDVSFTGSRGTTDPNGVYTSGIVASRSADTETITAMVGIYSGTAVLTEMVPTSPARVWANSGAMAFVPDQADPVVLDGPACRVTMQTRPAYCGKVLDVGGGGGAISAELYDPSSGTWAPAGSATVPTFTGHFRAVLLDGPECHRPFPSSYTASKYHRTVPFSYTAPKYCGDVLIIATGTTRIAEVYHPATGSWSPTATPLVDNADPVSPPPFNDCGWLLCVYSSSVVQGVSATLLSGPGCGVNCGKVLVVPPGNSATEVGMGQFDSPGTCTLPFLVPCPWVAAPPLMAKLYDPATGSWSQTGAMAVNPVGLAAVQLLNGKVLLAGGLAPVVWPDRWLPACGNLAQLYDPATNLFTPTGSMNHSRCPSLAVLADGRVLAAGDDDGPGNTAEIYDPATGSWSDTAAMSSPGFNPKAGRLLDGRVLVDGLWGTPELYNPLTGSWSSAGQMVNSGDSGVTVLPGTGRVLAQGGGTNGTASEVY